MANRSKSQPDYERVIFGAVLGRPFSDASPLATLNPTNSVLHHDGDGDDDDDGGGFDVAMIGDNRLMVTLVVNRCVY